MKLWKTQTGQLVAFTDMSDAHLANAIKYTRDSDKEQRIKDEHLGLLLEELNRRRYEHFMAEKKECPWCKGWMQRNKYESSPDDGPGWGTTTWQFVCPICSSRGPTHDRPVLAT